MRERLDFDARELTPALVACVAHAAAETRSFHRAEIALRKIGGHAVDERTVQRVVQDVGGELAERRDSDPRHGHPLAASPADPPDLAVVERDGGRIRTRGPGQGPGVHRAGEGWRETKNACLIKARRETFDHDPQPEPPACFSDPKHVAKIAETAALSVASPRKEAPDASDAGPGLAFEEEWRPKRLVRTVLASMAGSKEFGQQMAREAKRRRFFEAQAKAFLGDGLAWNWSIWKTRFADFTPILDFIHPLSGYPERYFRRKVLTPKALQR